MRRSRPLPYELHVQARVHTNANQLTLASITAVESALSFTSMTSCISTAYRAATR